MDPAVVVLSGIITVAIGLFVNAFHNLSKKQDNTHSQLDKITDRQTVVETKLDLFLHHAGFDVFEVNRVIKEHMDELKRNDKPSVGCIDPSKLYRKEEKNG